jgi:hypothetical protein
LFLPIFVAAVRSFDLAVSRGPHGWSRTMLPDPDQCWLTSDAGHHTSELRIVGLDRRAAGDG